MSPPAQDEDGFKLTGFTFRECGKNVAMTLHEEPIGSAEVARERNEWGKKIFSDPINRKMGEKFSASALALGRLKFGHALGLEGANPSLVMKLFSAATWWGAGSAGQYDAHETESVMNVYCGASTFWVQTCCWTFLLRSTLVRELDDIVDTCTCSFNWHFGSLAF